MTGSANKPVDILLVEDLPAHARLAREALAESGTPHRLHVVGDGDEALGFLRRAESPRPQLIILDLNLPRMSGAELLSELKGDPELAFVPVVVLTTSNHHDDVLASYRLHANCYIQKPRGFRELKRIMATLVDFWLEVVELPRRP